MDIFMFDFLMPLSEILRSNLTVFVTFCVIFGMLVGSFLNVVIHRLPKMMENAEALYFGQRQDLAAGLTEEEILAKPQPAKYTIVTPRSACPKCGHNIGALENIPVISYLMLSGKCKGCKTDISLRYPLIEALTGALIGAAAYKYGYSYASLFAFIFVFALVALTFIDLDTFLLPDDIVLPLLWLGLLFNLNTGFTDIKSAVIGAVVGYMTLWTVYWLFKLIRGKEGMGYGDFKLLAAIGAWFGWQMLPAVILLSAVVGSIIGIYMMLFKGKNKDSAIPFGPYLTLAGIAALFFGQQLMQFYLPR
jgi:leader peptidase (prepilin peptidase) / N-methyltransferase